MMLRRAMIAGAVLLVCLAALVVALPFIVPSQLVRQEVATQIAELTGRGVTLRGDQALRVFPNLSVRLTDIVIDGDVPGPERALVVAEQLEGRVRFLPLLFGRVELSAFTLTRPTIRLLRGADGRANWQLDGSALLSALEPSRTATGALQLGTFRIVDGTLQVIDEQSGMAETLSSATLSLSWPSSSTRAAVAGRGVWRGEPVDLSASLDQPAALAQPGSTSGVVVSISAAPLRMRFDGTVSPGSPAPPRGQEGLPVPWQAAGRLEMSSPSLRRAATWLGRDTEAGSTFADFTLEADLNLVSAVADLTDLSLSLDDNEAEGVLTIDAGAGDRQASLQGTLDFDRLDLTPYLDALRPTTTNSAPGDWRFLPVPDVFAPEVAIDLRVATRELTAAPFALGEAAGSVLLSPSRLVIGVGEAEAYGGKVRGSLSLERGTGDNGEERLASSLDVAVGGVRLGPLMAEVTDNARLTGALTLAGRIEGAGPTVNAHLRSADGRLEATVVDGEWRGIDLMRIMSMLMTGEIPLGGLPTGGDTEIDMLEVDVVAHEGTLGIEAMSLRSGPALLTLAGETALATQELDLEGSAAIVAEGAQEPAFATPFAIGGSWAQPRLIPDAQLLNR